MYSLFYRVISVGSTVVSQEKALKSNIVFPPFKLLHLMHFTIPISMLLKCLLSTPSKFAITNSTYKLIK